MATRRSDPTAQGTAATGPTLRGPDPRTDRVAALLRPDLDHQSGTTAVEYALIAGLVVLAIATAVAALGTELTQLYQAVVDGYPPTT